MHKSVGPVEQFGRFLTHAKLYLRAANTARPYPLPPTHRQCWNHQGTIPLIFPDIVLDEEGGGYMDL